jgi:hypothetical protein
MKQKEPMTTTHATHAADCDTRCGGTYVCSRCDRAFGWCNGAFDDMPALCDDCANLIQELEPCDMCTNSGHVWSKGPMR